MTHPEVPTFPDVWYRHFSARAAVRAALNRLGLGDPVRQQLLDALGEGAGEG